jgi:hypothetical protein
MTIIPILRIIWAEITTKKFNSFKSKRNISIFEVIGILALLNVLEAFQFYKLIKYNDFGQLRILLLWIWIIFYLKALSTEKRSSMLAILPTELIRIAITRLLVIYAFFILIVIADYIIRFSLSIQHQFNIEELSKLIGHFIACILIGSCMMIWDDMKNTVENDFQAVLLTIVIPFWISVSMLILYYVITSIFNCPVFETILIFVGLTIILINLSTIFTYIRRKDFAQ